VTAPHAPKDEHSALRTHPYKGSGALPLWLGMLGPGLAWIIGFAADYALVERACVSDTMLPLHLVMLLTVLLAAAGTAVAAREWRRTGRQWPDTEGGATARARFMAAAGTLLGGFFLLLLLAQWSSHLVIPPCLAS
jgi:hypothetical protein